MITAVFATTSTIGHIDFVSAQLVGGMLFMDVDPHGVDDAMFTAPAKCHTVSSTIHIG